MFGVVIDIRLMKQLVMGTISIVGSAVIYLINMGTTVAITDGNVTALH